MNTVLSIEEDCIDLLLAGAMIIDVRTSDEYAKGHSEESINVPIQNLTSCIPLIKRQNKPVLICSKKGIRSEEARLILELANIEAYNVGSWLNIQENLY